jgi:histidine triad (HIT) family protein
MSECIFCKIVRGEARSWKVYEDESVYAFLDINPVNEYHTLVIPKAHFENLFDIPERDLVAVTQAVRKIVLVYSSKLGIHNVQILSSSGREAQQDVFHFHFHIVPRHSGDRQNIIWRKHPEWVKNFDRLLEPLR